MAENLIVRNETELPPDVRALLHGPAPEGVWYLTSHPRVGHPFRFASGVTRVLLVAMFGLFLATSVAGLNGGSSRKEGFVITLSLALFSAGIHALCVRSKKKAERIEAALREGHLRFGLWLTAQHVLVKDLEGFCCASRKDIARTHVYSAGGGRPELLVITLRNKQKIHAIVSALDGWVGQAEKLRDEFEARLTMDPGISREKMIQMADGCRPRQKFREFVGWLDDETQRLKSGNAEKVALLEMANAILTSWPDSARSAKDEWFMLTEDSSTYEYGAGQTGSDKSYQGFKKGDASWLLPLCRTVYFNEAESIFPDVASVDGCASTFQGVPLTVIEFTGGMDQAVFEAFLEWTKTKPLIILRACNYSTERNSLSNLRAASAAVLADFKKRHNLA